MMKDVIIPTKTSNVINLLEITENYLGIIIGFKESKAVGYIAYYYKEWYFINSIDQEKAKFDTDSLQDLANLLITNGVCDSFKVVEFV